MLEEGRFAVPPGWYKVESVVIGCCSDSHLKKVGVEERERAQIQARIVGMIVQGET